MADDDKTWVTKSAMARWVAALVFALVTLVVFVIGTNHDSLCRHLLTSAAGTNKVCGPPTLVQLTPAAIVIALLLFPDLSELGITGLFSLKRAVSDQANRQRQTEQELAVIRQHFTLSQQQAVNVLIGDEIARAMRSIGPKQAAYEREQPAERPAQPNTPPPAPDQGPGRPRGAAPADDHGDFESGRETGDANPAATDNRLHEFDAHFGRQRGLSPAAQLIRLDAQLDAYRAMAELRAHSETPEARLPHLDEEQQRAADLFVSLFASELKSVKEARDAAADQQATIGEQTVLEALGVAEKLIGILNRRLGRPDA